MLDWTEIWRILETKSTPRSPGHLLLLCSLVLMPIEGTSVCGPGIGIGHPDWSVAYVAPYAMYCDAQCWDTFLLEPALHSRKIGSDYMGQPLLLTCINELWPPVTLSPGLPVFLPWTTFSSS